MSGAAEPEDTTGDDADEFERLVAPYRRELLVHAYRILGSNQDAEDALQEALTAAWRGRSGLRSAAAARSWLHRVTTNAALRTAERRGPRTLSWERASASDPRAELSPPVLDDRWVEPFLDPARSHDPEAVLLRREQVELAWIAALQRIPANQRAVLVLRDVLAHSAAEVAEMLGTTTAAVNSALQRARGTLAAHREAGGLEADGAHPKDGAAEGLDGAVVEDFVTAFNEGDVGALVRLLSAEARFTMPPLPAWFAGRDAIATFLGERVFGTPWRVRPIGPVNGWPAVFGEQFAEGAWRTGALMILHGRGREIGWLATFVDPGLIEDWRKFPHRDR